MSALADWLEENMTPCSFEAGFGLECPWCGMQRSAVHLFRGEWLDSLLIFPALIPGILLFFGLIVQLVFKFPKGAFYLKWNFILVVALIVGNYILKMLS